jgi:hypothetical protein
MKLKSALTLTALTVLLSSPALAEKHAKPASNEASSSAQSDSLSIPMIAIPGRNYEIGKTEVT